MDFIKKFFDNQKKKKDAKITQDNLKNMADSQLHLEAENKPLLNHHKTKFEELKQIIENPEKMKNLSDEDREQNQKDLEFHRNRIDQLEREENAHLIKEVEDIKKKNKVKKAPQFRHDVIKYGMVIIGLLFIVIVFFGNAEKQKKGVEQKSLSRSDVSDRFNIYDSDRKKQEEDKFSLQNAPINQSLDDTTRQVHIPDVLRHEQVVVVNPPSQAPQASNVVSIEEQKKAEVEQNSAKPLFFKNNQVQEKSAFDLQMEQIEKIEEELKKQAYPELYQNQGSVQSANYQQTRAEDNYMPTDVIEPLSPYQIYQGTIIPIILVTGINSNAGHSSGEELIIGRTLRDVYSSVTGEYLIIPAGSTIIGDYGKNVAWGQKRLIVSWDRLIRPDGTSIQLNNMQGVDLQGYSGYSDKIDMHFKEMAALLTVSTVMNLASGQIAYASDRYAKEDSARGAMTYSASNSAEDVTRVINTMAEKYLAVEPSIIIRPGHKANIMINKDIVLSPYLGNPGGAF